MKKSLRLVLSILALSLTVNPAVCAFGQTNQGEIAGVATDPSGAVIPNASITATNDETGSIYSTVSTKAGIYRFPSLQIGTYTVKASAPGFKALTESSIVVQVGSTTTVNLRFLLGDISQVITVHAGGTPGLQTQTSDVGGVISQRQIQELPLALGGLGELRALESFVFLVPGTVGPGTATAGQGSGPAQAAGIYLSKLGGGQNFGAEDLLDGISTWREENGSTFDEISPSVDAISQFKVITSTPPAQYGWTTGGVEDFVTKSGTNTYHGAVYDIFRNTALDANDWFNNGFRAACPITNPSDVAACQALYARAGDQKNDYGVTLGGPVVIPHLYNGRNKFLFFFSFEQFLKHQATTVVSSVPTTLERQGNFTQLLAANGTPTGEVNPCTGTENLYGEIFDPSTDTTMPNGQRCRQPFDYGGVLNVMPPSDLTPLGKAIANAFPLPQTAGLQNNYSYRAEQALSNTTYSIRADNNITPALKTFVSYSERDNTVPYGGTAPDFPGPAGADLLQTLSTHLARVGINYIFSPTLMNSFIFGVNRINNADISSEVTNGINYASQLGIANIYSDAYPNIIPQGLQNGSFGVTALGAALNSDDTETQFGISDNVSLEKGRNSIQLGFDALYHQFISLQENNYNGQFYGYSFETAAGPSGQGYGDNTGYGLAGLELGLPDYVRIISPQDPKWITKFWDGYVEDNFRATSNLTLNVGLRYDVDIPRTEARNQTSDFSPTVIDPVSGIPGGLVFGTNCHCNAAWANTYWKDLGPRVGFAYAPAMFHGKTTFHGGGAIIYAPLLYDDFGGDGADMLQGYVTSFQEGGDGFDPIVNLNQGAPALPPVPDLNPGLDDSGSAANPEQMEDIEPSFGRNAMVSEWNLEAQQQVAYRTVFTLGYTGNVGQNLQSELLQPNNINPKYLDLGDTLNSFDLASANLSAPYPTFNGTVGQALRPFPQYSNLTTPSDIENAGHSDYNALIASLDHSSGWGLTFDVSYTWSKTITDADSQIGGINGGVPGLAQNSDNLKTAKSISIQDIPNNLVINYLYNLPIGQGQVIGGHVNHFLNDLIGGITVGGIQRYLSGVPFSFGCADGPSVYNDCISLDHIGNVPIASGLNRHTVKPFDYLIPAEVGAAPAGPNPATDSIFNGLLTYQNPGYEALQTNPAFVDQNEDSAQLRNGGPFTFGNLPRVSGAVRNFPYLQEDFVLIKNTPIIDNKYKFQFKAECLDCFNRHNFQAPDSNPGDQTFGIPLAVVGGTTDSMRRLQLTGRVTF